MRFDVRRASIDDDLREVFEQYGQQVVAMALALGSNQGAHTLSSHPRNNTDLDGDDGSATPP